MGSFVRHNGRYREIAMALVRHGFGFMAEEIGLTRLIRGPLRWWRKAGPPETRTLAERIRLVLEELGPTFIKAGQLASTRSDLLPEPIVQELVKLQDQVPPFSAEEAKAIWSRSCRCRSGNCWPASTRRRWPRRRSGRFTGRG
ncbi:hypothetical protein HMSSN036_91520 [Paenibacillus macerans]|nr:hypothetical protein HMSSN036_91520 [Paenibacillus macerans]